jgi:hypothetical protein
MNAGRFLGLLTVVLIVLGVLMLSPIGDMINARLLEVQAENARAQADLLEAQNERLQLLPLTFAAMKDSLLVVAFIIGNQVALVAVIVYLVRELRREHAKRDVSVSGLR